MIDIMFAEIEPFLFNLQARKQCFAPGQSIFHLGDPVEVFHFVDAGAIRLALRQSDGSV